MRSVAGNSITRAGAIAGLALGIALASGASRASLIAEIESNDTVATAQSLDASFSLEFDPDIGDFNANTSLTIPHVSVRAAGDGTLDFYSFTVTQANTLVVLDIDTAATPGLDSSLWLYFEDLSNVVRNDYDTVATAGALGSDPKPGDTISKDSYIEQIVANPGLYIAVVGTPASGLPGYDAVPDNTAYRLHISVDQPFAVPAPAPLLLIGLGLVAGFMRRRPAA
jgi:hypothetical protein